MNGWQKALREELEPGLVAYTEDGRETQVSLDFDFKDGALSLEWKDGDDQQWFLTIPYATLMALTQAMVKRLYPSARPRRRA
ncbi:MAG: hypothetical protein GTO63_16155 [Anaerolineae bacterium]|nr:hypothetical protein [Anaerolineae bacterium]NIN96349.1 hypothetical protein [Anaerolineae bacterium]NIQ79384.1 hypothetical protein [Anaerolineae bacterium]